MKPTAIFTEQQALNSAALSHDVVIGTDTPDNFEEYEIDLIALAAASAISQTYTVSIISVSGSAYTFVLTTATLSSATSSVASAAKGYRVRRGDTIRAACTNSGTPAIVVSSEIRLIPIG